MFIAHHEEGLFPNGQTVKHSQFLGPGECAGSFGNGHGMRRTSLPSLDPYYSDYHVWNDDEVVYYHQWARDEHRDFRKLPPEEQKEYWTWRHSRGDHDHDRH